MTFKNSVSLINVLQFPVTLCIYSGGGTGQFTVAHSACSAPVLVNSCSLWFGSRFQCTEDVLLAVVLVCIFQSYYFSVMIYNVYGQSYGREDMDWGSSQGFGEGEQEEPAGFCSQRLGRKIKFPNSRGVCFLQPVPRFI